MRTSDKGLSDTKGSARGREAARLVNSLRSGGGPLINLTRQDIVDIVMTFAPYGAKVRAEYFKQLQEECERRNPCQYP